ncbi:MAG: hypothetical protein EOP49_53520, partial [Sphingobacteriales bacterium]
IETSIQANRFFGQMIPVFYLLDYRTGKYERITDSFAGYHTAASLNSGVQLMLNIVDTEHLRLYDQKIFPERLKILSGIEPKEHQNYIFSLNSTLTHRMGYTQDFLQRNCYISDETGNPLFSMGILINLNHYNDRYPIIQTVEKIGMGGVSGAPLKQRSTEVIRYLCQQSGHAFPVIGVGGIATAEDALEKLRAGASLVQVYTGFIYEGPTLAKEICKVLAEEVDYSHLQKNESTH